MIKNSLTRLIRTEIAQRGSSAQYACYFLTLLTLTLSLLLKSNLIFNLSILISVIVYLQTRSSKKVLKDPLNDNEWNKLRLFHWLYGGLTALALIATAVKSNSNLHLFVMFTILAGTAGHFLLVTSLDRTLVLPTLSALHLPLIGIAIFNYANDRAESNLFLLVIYINCLIYSVIQYRFLHGQLTKNLNARLQLEKLNAELKQIDQKQDYFVQLVLTLLSNKEPLDEVFQSLIRFFENQNSSWICSILFLDQSKKHFNQVYAPSIADFYNKAITTLEITPTAGSCGTAAFTGQRVIVEDIQTNPLWIPYRQLAQAANLAACWSQPIKDKNGSVLGTFAIYHRAPQVPAEKDIRMIEQAAELVSIILQHFETENMVRKTQEQLSLIYESSIDTMWLIDIEEGENYRFRSINDAFTQATGFQREQVVNKLIEEVLPPATLETIRARYREVATTGNVCNYLDVAVFPTGTKAGQIRLKPIKDETGKCTKILGIVQDVTEKQRINSLLTQRETELMYAQKVARIGDWKWDMVDGKNTYTSKEAAEMLEMELNPSIPTSINDVTLFTEESWKKAFPIVSEAINSGKPYQVDLERIMKDGQHRWFTCRGEVIERDTNGTPTLLAGTMQDITERKNLENNLQAALISRDEFISVASHELKTPLTTLQLSLHGIYRNLEEIPSTILDKVKPKLDRVKSQSERLASLTNNLLDVTRMGAGKLHMEPHADVNFSELLESAIKKHEDTLAKSHMPLKKNIEPSVIGFWDEIRLEQIVTNLLTNAIKYGNGKPLEINLRKKNNLALLEVHDQGIGIPQEKQQKIFDRFERAVNENYQGLGLGLWIVSEIVKAHNGRIWVESIENQGSKFSVELPIKKVNHEH